MLFHIMLYVSFLLFPSFVIFYNERGGRTDFNIGVFIEEFD
jgi:hypothetical protein